ncbi:MAG: ABC transporter substrate-binding protein [Oscillospiraceae bacterium]|nr:ABC transporter substrate-binding protein [Oscillospiraceae bacterium]
MAGCKEDNTSSGSTNNGSTPATNNSTPAGETSAADPSSIVDDDKVLSIGVWGDNGDITHLLEYFRANANLDEGVTVEMVDCGTGGEAAREQYANLLKDGNTTDLDIIICDMDWVRNYVEDDKMTVPLSTIGITAADMPDAFAYTIGVGTDNNGVLKGASFQATPGAFFYRSDLAKQYLNVETPDQMQAKVKDWDTFKATAKELADASGGACKLLDSETSLWQVFQCNRTKAWVVDNKLEMDTAESFYDFAKELYDAKGVTDATGWGEGWEANVQEGKALGEFAPTWGLTGLNGSILGDMAKYDKDTKTPTYEMGLCDGPQAWYWGGSYFCVTNKCNTKKTAAEWIRFYTCNKDSMKGYSEAYGDYMNNKSAMAEMVSAGVKNPSLVGGQDHFAILNKTVGNIDVTGKLTTYDSVIKGKFNDSVRKYMLGELDKQAAIDDFKNEVRAAFPDLTVE